MYTITPKTCWLVLNSFGILSGRFQHVISCNLHVKIKHESRVLLFLSVYRVVPQVGNKRWSITKAAKVKSVQELVVCCCFDSTYWTDTNAPSASCPALSYLVSFSLEGPLDPWRDCFPDPGESCYTQFPSGLIHCGTEDWRGSQKM